MENFMIQMGHRNFLGTKNYLIKILKQICVSFCFILEVKFGANSLVLYLKVFLCIPLNSYGHPNSEPKLFRTRFVKRP